MYSDAVGKIEEGLEFRAQETYKSSSEHGIQASIAISLKRIADALEDKYKEQIISHYKANFET